MAIALFLILWVLNLVHSLGHWVDESAFTGDENDGSSVMQHHLVAVQYGNATLLMDALPSTSFSF